MKQTPSGSRFVPAVALIAACFSPSFRESRAGEDPAPLAPVPSDGERPLTRSTRVEDYPIPSSRSLQIENAFQVPMIAKAYDYINGRSRALESQTPFDLIPEPERRAVIEREVEAFNEQRHYWARHSQVLDSWIPYRNQVFDGIIGEIPGGSTFTGVDIETPKDITQEIENARSALRTESSSEELAKQLEKSVRNNGWEKEFLDAVKFAELSNINLDPNATDNDIRKADVQVDRAIRSAETLRDLVVGQEKIRQEMEFLTNEIRKGKSELSIQLRELKTQLDNGHKELQKFIEDTITQAFAKVSPEILKLSKWIKDEEVRRKAQAEVDLLRQLFSGFAAVVAVYDPKAAEILKSMAGVAIAVATASAAGWSAGPIVGVVVAAIQFTITVASPPTFDAQYEYVRKSFIETFENIRQLSQQMNYRFNWVDFRTIALLDSAARQQKQLSDITEQVYKLLSVTSNTLSELRRLISQVESEAIASWKYRCSAERREFDDMLDAARNPIEVPGAPVSENVLKENIVKAVRHALKTSSKDEFVDFSGAVTNSAPGILAQRMGLFGPEFFVRTIYEHVVRPSHNSVGKADESFDSKALCNPRIFAEGVGFLLYIVGSGNKDIYPLINAKLLSDLKETAKNQERFYEQLVSPESVSRLCALYVEQVKFYTDLMREVALDEDYRVSTGIPAGIDIFQGTEQFTPEVFGNSKLPIDAFDGFKARVSEDAIRKFVIGLTEPYVKDKLFPQKQRNYAKQYDAADVAQLDFTIPTDLFAFSLNHKLRTSMGRPTKAGAHSVPGYELDAPKISIFPDEVSEQVETRHHFYLADDGRPISQYAENHLKYRFHYLMECGGRLTGDKLALSYFNYYPRRSFELAYKHDLDVNWGSTYKNNAWEVEFAQNSKIIPELLAHWGQARDGVVEACRASMDIIQLYLQKEQIRPASGNLSKPKISTQDIRAVKISIVGGKYERLGLMLANGKQLELILDSKPTWESGSTAADLLSDVERKLVKQGQSFDLELGVTDVIGETPESNPGVMRYRDLQRSVIAKLINPQTCPAKLLDAWREINDTEALLMSIPALVFPGEILANQSLMEAMRKAINAPRLPTEKTGLNQDPESLIADITSRAASLVEGLKSNLEKRRREELGRARQRFGPYALAWASRAIEYLENAINGQSKK